MRRNGDCDGLGCCLGHSEGTFEVLYTGNRCILGGSCTVGSKAHQQTLAKYRIIRRIFGCHRQLSWFPSSLSVPASAMVQLSSFVSLAVLATVVSAQEQFSVITPFVLQIWLSVSNHPFIFFFSGGVTVCRPLKITFTGGDRTYDLTAAHPFFSRFSAFLAPFFIVSGVVAAPYFLSHIRHY